MRAPFLTFLLRRKGDTNRHCWTSLEWALPDITGAQMGASRFTKASGSSRRLQRQSGSPRRDEMVSRSISQTRRHFTPDDAIKFTILCSIQKIGVVPVFWRIETNRRKRDNSTPDSVTLYVVREFATNMLPTRLLRPGPDPQDLGAKSALDVIKGKFGCFGWRFFRAKRTGPLQPSIFLGL